MSPKHPKQVSATEFKAKCLCIIHEMGSDGYPVTITRQGKPVALLSPLPSEATTPSLIGMMRGAVIGYDAPFSPVIPLSDWSAVH